MRKHTKHTKHTSALGRTLLGTWCVTGTPSVCFAAHVLVLYCLGKPVFQNVATSLEMQEAFHVLRLDDGLKGIKASQEKNSKGEVSPHHSNQK